MTQPSLFVQPPPEPVGPRLARKAAEKATRIAPGWLDLACAYVETYARETSAPWLLEDARAYAERRGLPVIPNRRAFGHVVRVLKARKVIEACGAAPAKSSHGSLKILWRVR